MRLPSTVTSASTLYSGRTMRSILMPERVNVASSPSPEKPKLAVPVAPSGLKSRAFDGESLNPSAWRVCDSWSVPTAVPESVIGLVAVKPMSAALTSFPRAIGPLALGTAVTLAVAARDSRPAKRVLDAATALGLAGVLAATIMVTVPINRQLEQQPPADYPSDRSQSLARNWSRAHAVRTTLGISAFVCAVASNITNSKK